MISQEGDKLGSFEGYCPHCNYELTVSQAVPGVNCPACDQRIILRNEAFLTVEQAKTIKPSLLSTPNTKTPAKISNSQKERGSIPGWARTALCGLMCVPLFIMFQSSLGFIPIWQVGMTTLAVLVMPYIVRIIRRHKLNQHYPIGRVMVGLWVTMLFVQVANMNTPAYRRYAQEHQTEAGVETQIEQQTFSTEKVTPNYEIVYTIPNKRYDGGTSLYVLIDPADPTKSAFKSDIQTLVSRLVADYGAKTSIDFFDNREALEIGYKEYGDGSLNRPTTAKENKLLAFHNVAAFSGDLETGPHLNTLFFLPAANTVDYPKLAKQIETIEFNPAPNQEK
jgi:DNA-directed RNA polymerase subunit RPC12/RpoP